MARPSRAQERRNELLPSITEAFTASGYRRTTTADLARACGLQETQLYRLWPSKKHMFLAVIDHLYELETAGWKALLAGGESDAAIAAVLTTEAKRRGETGLHRITLAALSEADDPEIHAAVSRMYQQFHRFIRDTLKRHHESLPKHAPQPLDPALAAWALIGLGTVINIAREFDLFATPTQQRLMTQAGLHLAGARDG